MAGPRLPVPRLAGVSQEQFMQQLYPQVRPSRGGHRGKPRSARPYHVGGSEVVSCGPGRGEEGRAAREGRVALQPRAGCWGVRIGTSVTLSRENSSTFPGAGWPRG